MGKESDFCPAWSCGLEVLPQDPDRVLLDGKIPFHRRCLGKVQLEAEGRHERVNLIWHGNHGRVVFEHVQ